MKYVIYIGIVLLVFSCKNKTSPVTINGHVWNKAENVNFANAKIKLKEYDYAVQTNTKEIASTFTDNQGNFSFTFTPKKNRNYSVFIDVNTTDLIVTSLYPGLIESNNFSPTQIPSNIELIAATPSYTKLILIHDLGADSMLYELSHQFINFYGSRMLYGEEINSSEAEVASGNWIYKTTKYNNGNTVISIDTLKHEINQHHVMEIHY